VNAKLFAKTNLATSLIWGVWWPAMLWIAVLFGRAWCMVCPLEVVSNVSERLARASKFPQRPLRKWMASGAVIVGLYALIQMLVAGAYQSRAGLHVLVSDWPAGDGGADRAGLQRSRFLSRVLSGGKLGGCPSRPTFWRAR
jgi:hypothetical protein